MPIATDICKTHWFEDIDINSMIYSHTLKLKKVTVGFETKCQDCGITANFYGSLDIEIKGEDY